MTRRSDPRDMAGKAVDELGRHPDAGLGLRVDDAEPALAESHVAHEVAKLAHPHAAAAQHLDDDAAADVRAAGRAEVLHLEADGRLREPELGCNVA